MAWIKILTGTSPYNLQKVTDIQDLAKGTEFRMDIETGWFPYGPLADLIGAEFAGELYAQGADVIDVEGTGWNRIRIHCVSDPIPIWGIILAFSTLGVMAYMITKIEVWADIVEVIVPGTVELAKWIAVGVAAICGVVLVTRMLPRGET